MNLCLHIYTFLDSYIYSFISIVRTVNEVLVGLIGRIIILRTIDGPNCMKKNL